MSCKQCGLTIRAFSPNKDFCSRDCMIDYEYQQKAFEVEGQCFDCGCDILAYQKSQVDEQGGREVLVHSECLKKRRQRGVA